MTVFPTISTHILEIKIERYDITQLFTALQSALKERPEESVSVEATASPLFHLHTLTTDITLHPPSQTIRYHRREEPNPEYEEFQGFRQTLCEESEPLNPISLIPTGERLLRSPTTTQRGVVKNRRSEQDNSSNSVFIFLPSSHASKPLVQLPALPSHVASEWNAGSKAWDLQHWLHAAIALDPKEYEARKTRYRDELNRFHLKTTLQLIWVPADEGGIDIKLMITTDVLVDMRALFVPLPEHGPQLVGLVLYSLLPAPAVSRSTSDSENRANALRTFFDCLEPAPDHPITFNISRLQPNGLKCKLYPFQARTLALLLQRERAPMMEDPKLPKLDPPGFWQVLDFGDEAGRVAYRRSTGDIVRLGSKQKPLDPKGKGKAREVEEDGSDLDGLQPGELEALPHFLDLSGVKGTMLCEEMGLGKTVEAIALTLLHRHPLSTLRGPDLKVDSSAGYTGSFEVPRDRSDRAGRTSKSASKVPVIDLLLGPPDIDSPNVSAWVKAEHAAFEGKIVWDAQAELHVTEVATTLVVTPPSLLKQWVAEIRRHAPALRVCVYEGWKSLQKGIQTQRSANVQAFDRAMLHKKRKHGSAFMKKTVNKYQKLNEGESVKMESEEEDEEEEEVTNESSLEICQRQFVEYVRAHDIVLTTYGDLGADLKVALPAPPRSRRSTANYQMGERPRSPLLMVEWWRVIMDEVQLQGDQSDAAHMVSLVPRVNSLAMSGTPAKADIKDLMGSLKFLRVPFVPYNQHLWHRLQQPAVRPAFEGLFRHLAVRTTKREVAAEFDLPAQSRYIVPIELSEIESHYYDDTLERQREALGLPADMNEPRPADWVLNRAIFRNCLYTLRQICTHIQVGQMQQPGARTQRLQLGKELMTMGEALRRMKEDHTQELLVESRSQMRHMIRKAQLLILDDTDDLRHHKAIALYQSVREKITKQIGPVREAYHRLVSEKEGDHIERELSTDSPQRDISQHERDWQAAVKHAQLAVHLMLLIDHQACFFEGDAHHVREEVDQETTCYAQADALRKEILARPLNNANKSVDMLTRILARSGALSSVRDLRERETDLRGGILSGGLATQTNELLNVMNGNAELVYNWRHKIIELLSTPIESEPPVESDQAEDTKPENEYYAQALQAQGDIEAYLIAYAAAVADRKEFLTEDRTTLNEIETRVQKKRTTRAAQLAEILAEDQTDVESLAAELMKERQSFRQAREDNDCKRPLKGIVFDLNPIIIGDARSEEKAIARKMSETIKKVISKQLEAHGRLEKELELFRTTFNRRLKYFAALQEISDSVTAPEFRDLQVEIQDAQNDIVKSEAKLAKMAVKGRYLQHLGFEERERQALKDDCIICMGSSDDTKAVLLDCGHFFCVSCYREFRRSMHSRKCPSCRAEIDERLNTIIRLTNADGEAIAKADADKAEAEPNPDAVTESQPLKNEPSSRDLIEAERQSRKADMKRLKYMEAKTRRSIAELDMMGEYGSKINFLIKHLLWFKAKEPRTRHVIFSNWSDSLGIVMVALRNNGIKFVSFDQGSGRNKNAIEQFKRDEGISVFLLHAERESAGLTLTSCRVVHLLEPVLRHSFELQAIGRVDRLGQDKETEVYCYATMDTVESRILSQGVRNGTSIYLKDETADEVVAEMPNVASAAHKGGDLSNDGNEEELLKLIM